MTFESFDENIVEQVKRMPHFMASVRAVAENSKALEEYLQPNQFYGAVEKPSVDIHSITFPILGIVRVHPHTRMGERFIAVVSGTSYQSFEDEDEDDDAEEDSVRGIGYLSRSQYSYVMRIPAEQCSPAMWQAYRETCTPEEVADAESRGMPMLGVQEDAVAAISAWPAIIALAICSGILVWNGVECP